MSPSRLNQSCHCISLDSEQLAHHFETSLLQQGVLKQVLSGREHLFAPYGVFVSGQQVAAMQATIAAVEELVSLPAYRQQRLAGSPWPQPAGPGVFMGYDFHLQPDGAQLIEVNTNAGGAFLNALMLRSQRACCEPVAKLLPSAWCGEDAVHCFAEMFRHEWRLARGEQPLRSLLILDDVPEQQFLYPEFQLFRELFRKQGWWCEIADPEQLAFRDGRLWLGKQAIDLVYNRLTDFDLSEPRHAALRQAYLADATVLTPNPAHYQLYAHKRNLVLLSDTTELQLLGLSQEARRNLASHVPAAEVVTVESAERLWSQRKSLFFKPFTGYGGKAAYRGDKLTKAVWGEILGSQQYIAQAFAPPAERALAPELSEKPLKFDLRCYTYGGRILLMAARLYQGQTTNFRTPFGGFAAVYAPAPKTPVQPLWLSQSPTA